MKPGSKRLGIVLSGVLVTALLGSGVWWWHTAQVRAAVAAVLPERPNLEGFVPELGVRIEQAEQRARSLRTARAGLAELARLYHANGFMPQASACERGLIAIDPGNPLWPHLQAHIIGGYGDLDAALPLLERTIHLAPDYLPARIRLGDTLLKRNESADAAATYRDVLSHDPHNGFAISGLARTELAAGDPEAARQRLQLLVQGQPQFAPAWGLLISIDEQLGDDAAAANPPAPGSQHGTSARDAGPLDRRLDG